MSDFMKEWLRVAVESVIVIFAVIVALSAAFGLFVAYNYNEYLFWFLVWFFITIVATVKRRFFND